MTSSKLYTAIDLINKVLDFIAMTPDSNDWTLLSQKNNPPRYIRLLQIHSLLKAFNCNNTFTPDSDEVIKSFKSGQFVAFRKLSEYKPVTTLINDYIKDKDIYIDVEGSLNIEKRQIHRLFSNLMNYKQLVTSLEHFNYGHLAASSIHTVFSIELTNSISSTINCYELNKVLSLIVSPSSRRFTEQQLLDDFDYPNENLADIDVHYI